jgi:glycosyltransferase involved in cell wall biosynthesis
MKFFIYLFQIAGAERVMYEYANQLNGKIYCIFKDQFSLERVKNEYNETIEIEYGLINFILAIFSKGKNLVFLNRAGLIFTIFKIIFGINYHIFIHSMPPKSYIGKKLMKLVFLNSTKIFFISNQQKKIYLKMELITRNDYLNKCKVILNPISTLSKNLLNHNSKKILSSKIIPKKKNNLIFGICARYDPLKNLEFGIQCFEKSLIAKKKVYIKTDYIDKHLILAGRDTDNFNNDKIIGLGELPNNFVSLEDFYENIDCLLIPSLEEVSPVVAIEALCSGLPIISTNVGDLKELSKNFKWLEIVDIGDSNSFISKISNISKNISYHRLERYNRHAYAKKQFIDSRSAEILSKKLQDLINEV